MDRPLQKSGFARAKVWSGALAGLGALAGAWLMLSNQPGNTLDVVHSRLTLSTVTAGTFEDFIPVRGTVTPLKTVYLDAIEGGRIEKIHIEDGALVKKGELLFDLSNTKLQLDVISREAQVTEQINNLNTLKLQFERNRLDHKRNLIEIDYKLLQLKRDLKRKSGLLRKGAIPKVEVERIQDELQYLRALRRVTRESQVSDARLSSSQMVILGESVDTLRTNLKFARGNLENLYIKAPVAGKITAISAEVGQSLARGQRLGQVDSPGRFKITAWVDEFHLGRLVIGQQTDLTHDNEEYALWVTKLYPRVKNGQFKVDLKFAGEQPAGLQNGQTLHMKLMLGAAEQALMVPNGSYYQDTGGKWVFVVTPDGTHAVRRPVEFGRRNTRFVEILGGLKVGERVITSPYSNYMSVDNLLLEAGRIGEDAS